MAKNLFILGPEDEEEDDDLVDLSHYDDLADELYEEEHRGDSDDSPTE